MKRIYDMNYDHWVEACGPESYKSTYDYVDLDMQKVGLTRYHLGYTCGDMDKLVEDPVKSLSGQDFDNTNFADLYSEEQLDELNNNLQEIFITIRDQFKSEVPSIIQSAFESSCDIFNEEGSRHADINYDSSKKLLTISADKAYKIQEATYWVFYEFARKFERLVKDTLLDKFGSNFNAQTILSNEVGKPIVILEGFKMQLPNIAQFIYHSNHSQDSILNQFKIESDAENVTIIDGHIMIYGKGNKAKRIKQRLAEGMYCKVVENINEAPGSVIFKISNLNHEVSDISYTIRNDGPLGKDSMNQKRFATKLKVICQSDDYQEILPFVDISSIVKRIDPTKYFEELNEDLGDLQIDESKSAELIKSTIEKECGDYFDEWIEEPCKGGLSDDDDPEYFFKFSTTSQPDEETARTLNTKLRVAGLGISNYNDELVNDVYQKEYNRKTPKTIEAELFDILDFDGFFKYVCDNSEIDLNDDERDQLYDFVKDQFSKVGSLKFSESEFIEQSQTTVKEEVSRSVSVVLSYKDANMNSTDYD